ncbi:MAG: hypothetical protein WC343_15450 [Bacilli bacterium]
MDIFDKVKNDNIDMDWSDIIDKYNLPISKDTLRKSSSPVPFGSVFVNEYLKNKAENINVISDEIERKSNVEYKDGNYTYDKLIEICENEEMTPEFLLEAHGLDKTKWKIVSYKNNYWHSQIKGGKRLVMYQSKVTVKPYNYDEVSPYALKEWFEQFTPKPITNINRIANYGQGNNCLLLPIADLHYNLLATTFITGNEYNCQIARDRFLSVIDDNIEQSKDKGICKIIFPVGNDLFNANGINGTTFKGTPQDNEKHIFEAYIELFEIMVEAITRLGNIAPVEVIYIPSNHDKEVCFYFLYNLHTQFKNEKKVDVIVDFSPICNKYRRFGNTLMMFTHDAKVDKTGNIILDESCELKDGAKYVEVFLAHLHSEMVKSDRNVTVRRLTTISGKSAWTVESNYGSNNVCQSFIYNDKYNIRHTLYTMVD